MRLERAPLLGEHRRALGEPRDFQLRPQNILLRGFADGIADLRDLLESLQRLPVFLQNREAAVNIGKVEVGLFHFRRHAPRHRLVRERLSVGIARGDFRAQARLARVGDHLLSHQLPGAGGIAPHHRERRQRVASVAEGNGGVRPGAGLRNPRAFGLHRATRGQDFRIALRCFLNQLGEAQRRAGLARRVRALTARKPTRARRCKRRS